MVYSLRTRTVAIAVIAGLAVAAFLVFGSGGSGRQARADSAAIAGDTVSVQGTGTVQGVPDRMTATFGVHATRGTVQDALDAVAHDAQRVIAALRHAGVSNADMRTTDLQLYPHYTNRGGRDGYDASETVTATFHDLGTAGRHISATVASAGNAATVSGLSFDLSSDTKLLGQARSAAFADAKARALGGVPQNFIRFVEFLKFFFCLFLVFGYIRMILARQLPKRLFDFHFARVSGHPQDFIIVFVLDWHIRWPAPRSGSSSHS